MIDDSEEGSEQGSGDSESGDEAEDNGGEGNSTAAAIPPAPQDVPPNEDTKDVGGEEEGAITSQEGAGDTRPKTGDSEVSLPTPLISYKTLHLAKSGTPIIFFINYWT
jgi:hypothetical protein